jgi:hypothetical protein
MSKHPDIRVEYRGDGMRALTKRVIDALPIDEIGTFMSDARTAQNADELFDVIMRWVVVTLPMERAP